MFNLMYWNFDQINVLSSTTFLANDLSIYQVFPYESRPIPDHRDSEGARPDARGREDDRGSKKTLCIGDLVVFCSLGQEKV